MNDIRAVEPGEYNKLLATALKERKPEFVAPEWIIYAKTGTNKERPTQDTDFWHNRAASILRQLYVRGTVGVQRLRTRYGGKKNRGARPSEFRRGGGKIIRTILQQAEQAGLVAKKTEGKAGRSLTDEGRSFLEGVGK